VFFYTLFGLLIFLQRRTLVRHRRAVLRADRGRYFFPPSEPVRLLVQSLIIEFVFGMVVAVAYREGIRLRCAGLDFGPVRTCGVRLVLSQAHFFDRRRGCAFLCGCRRSRSSARSRSRAASPAEPILARRRIPWRCSYSIYLVHTLRSRAALCSAVSLSRQARHGLICPDRTRDRHSVAAVYLYVEKPMIDYFARKIEARAPSRRRAVASPATAP